MQELRGHGWQQAFSCHQPGKPLPLASLRHIASAPGNAFGTLHALIRANPSFWGVAEGMEA
jgi:hypothetical protein